MVVLHSTTKSVRTGSPSAAAAFEVAAATALYWWCAVHFQTQKFLWVSIAVAPLLLLRSKPSMALGAELFAKYVDKSFEDFRELPKREFKLFQFIGSTVLQVAIAAAVAFILTYLWLPNENTWVTILMTVLIVYAATQAGIAATIAISPVDAVAIAKWKIAGFLRTLGLVTSVVASIWLSGGGIFATVLAVIMMTALATLASIEAPSVISNAGTLGEKIGRGDIRRLTVAQEALRQAPFSFIVFLAAVCLGGWSRTIVIRFHATIRHLRAGIREAPNNWWHTLFIADFFTPPELVPGYRRTDFFNISHVWSRIRAGESWFERGAALIMFAILYLPGYVYRLSIKSTCYYYWPIIYLARPTILAGRPELLADLLWRDHMEWVRRFVSVVAISLLLLSNMPAIVDIRATLPPILVSPLEYFFVIDLGRIAIWQWFVLLSAAITLIIFGYVGRFIIFVKHAQADTELSRSVRLYGLWFEYLMRWRTIFIWLFVIMAIGHAILWLSPWGLRSWLPEYILDLLRSLYGPAMP
jgi:hypothetical protein